MIFQSIKMALKSIFANKMRAFLTMLGIIIGIGAVIGIMTLGDSLTGYMTSQMQQMGTNNVTLSVVSKDSNSITSIFSASVRGLDEKDLISDEMLDMLRAEFPDKIESYSFNNSVGSGETTDGKKHSSLSLTGVNREYMKSNNIALLEGRFFTDRDVEESKKVAVVSEVLARNMFGASDETVIGRQITVSITNRTTGTVIHTGVYTIVGVYEYARTILDVGVDEQDISTDVYIPITTAQRISGTKGYASITVMTTAGSDSTAIADELASYMNSRFYSRNKNYSIASFSMESMLETLTDMLGTLQIAIAAIAAISLLVGGIGVMNIMLVSITERTREIGTRKALGATNGEIRSQFIIEAIIICLIGGAIGILFGIGLGMIGASLLGFPAKASLQAIALATGFSMAIGLFFGYYPANKAAKLDPIEALRYE